MITKSTPSLLLIAVLFLSGCQTTGTPDRASDEYSRLDSAIEEAIIKTAEKGGSPKAEFIILEKKYKRDSSNPSYALAYAQALRKRGAYARAATILKPFSDQDLPFSGVNTEMSVIALEQGDYDMAEIYAQLSVVQDPKDYTAYRNLGITLDAKEMHIEAERSFRKSLEYWVGDPTSTMNDLALNLATQGDIESAIEMLECAKKLSPDRVEIERNLRIIRTLNER